MKKITVVKFTVFEVKKVGRKKLINFEGFTAVSDISVFPPKTNKWKSFGLFSLPADVFTLFAVRVGSLNVIDDSGKIDYSVLKDIPVLFLDKDLNDHQYGASVLGEEYR